MEKTLKKHRSKNMFQKSMVILFSLALLFSPLSNFSSVVHAQTFTDGDYEFSVNGDRVTATITDYTGMETNLEIPDTVGTAGETYTVTVIGKDAFREKGLESVGIPDSVETIGHSAFRSNALENVDIPNSVIEIDYYSFYNNDNGLKTLTIGENVETIGWYAFALNALESIDIPDSVREIGLGAFHKNELTSVTIGEGIERLGDINTRGEPGYGYGVFQSNNLESITIPNNIKVIGDYAFYNNDNENNGLISVTIGENVEMIGEGAFQHNALKELVIPDSVTRINRNAFMNNELTSVTLGDGLTTINGGTFEENYLENVVIPNTVTFIGTRAFFNNKLTSVTLGESVETINGSAFQKNNLENIVIPKNINAVYGSAFNENNLQNVTILNPETEVYNYAFGHGDDTATIHGYYRTSAENYANTHDYLFESLPVVVGGDEIPVQLGATIDIVNSSGDLQGRIKVPAYDDVESGSSADQIGFDATMKVDYSNLSSYPNGLTRGGPVLDITFKDYNGDVINIDDGGEFELSLRANDDAENPVMYHYAEDDWEEIDSTQADGMLHGTVTHFSTYGVLAENNEPVERDILVTKEWVGEKADSAIVYLVIDGVQYTQEIAELNESNNWEYVFTGVEIGIGNDLYEIGVEEEPIEGYDVEVSGSMDDGFVVTNTKIEEDPEIEYMDITVTKEWIGEAEDEAIAHLIINGDRYDGAAVMNESTDWEYTFYDVVYSVDGEVNEFDIEEEPIDGYEIDVSGGAEDGFTITNTKIEEDPEIEYTNITVTKEWVGEAQDEAIAHLFINGDRYEEPAVMNEATDWEYTFYDVVYSVDGEVNEFDIEEEPIDGYEIDVSGSAEDGFTITNTKIVEEPEVEMIDITVTKEWIGEAQDEAVAHLIINGDRYEEPAVMNEATNWTYMFYDVVYSVDGEVNEFDIEEEPIDGYEIDVSGSAEDGFTITNTEVVTVPEPDLIDITVTKEWVGEAQEEATVYLLINGDRYEEGEVILNEANDWTHTYKGLSKAINGFTFEYSIEEEPIDGYEVSISGNVEEGFVVTNTEITDPIDEPEEPIDEPEEPIDEPEDPVEEPKEPEDPVIEPEEPTEDPKEEPKDPKETPQDDDDKLPKTATNHYNLLLVGSLVLILGLSMMIVMNRRKKV